MFHLKKYSTKRIPETFFKKCVFFGLGHSKEPMMMNESEMTERLMKAVGTSDFDTTMEQVVDELESAGAGIEYVEPILRFMEANPAEEYGSPGPLVHFMEGFYRDGYKNELLRSIARRPTAQTVWMLNRLVNGEKDKVEHQRLIDVLLAVQEHPHADEDTKNRARHFFQHQQH